MSQWGTTREFKGARSRIRVMPHVATDAWAVARRDSVIEDLHLLEVYGDRKEAETIFENLKGTFEGQPYHRWVDYKEVPDDGGF